MADEITWVTLKLSNPLTAQQAERLGAKEVKEYPSPGMSITVPRAAARGVIDAGYATVDPEDSKAVAEALKGNAAPAAAKSASSPSASGGNGK